MGRAAGHGLGWLRFFEEVPEPRQKAKVLYPLPELLLCCLVGVLCGAEGWVEVEEYGEAKLDFLRRFLPFDHGIPSPFAARSGIARPLARADHVERLVVGREAQPVRVGKLRFRDCDLQFAARIPAIDRGRQFALAAADDPGIGRADQRLQHAERVGRAPGLVGMALIEPVAIGRVGEPNAAVHMRHDIVRRVERFSLEIVGDDL
jgi:hypothetical protein